MPIRHKAAIFALAFLVGGLLMAAEDQKIYRGSEVPEGWNGSWPSELLTVPEKTDFTRSTSSYQIQEFINTLKWNSENVYVINMFISALRKVGSAVVLANPRVTITRRGQSLRKAGRLSSRRHPSRRRVGGQRSSPDTHARNPSRKKEIPARRPHHHRHALFQRRWRGHLEHRRGHRRPTAHWSFDETRWAST